MCIHFTCTAVQHSCSGWRSQNVTNSSTDEILNPETQSISERPNTWSQTTPTAVKNTIRRPDIPEEFVRSRRGGATSDMDNKCLPANDSPEFTVTCHPYRIISCCAYMIMSFVTLNKMLCPSRPRQQHHSPEKPKIANIWSIKKKNKNRLSKVAVLNSIKYLVWYEALPP